MAHARAQIRDAVVSALTGLTTTGSRVYSGRTRALAKDHQPSLLVYATSETSDVDASGRKLLRILLLVVEGRVVATGASAASDIESTLDTVASEVEARLTREPSLGGLAQELTLTRTVINAVSPGESHAGEVRMEFRVAYRTRETEPQTAV